MYVCTVFSSTHGTSGSRHTYVLNGSTCNNQCVNKYPRKALCGENTSVSACTYVGTVCTVHTLHV